MFSCFLALSNTSLFLSHILSIFGGNESVAIEIAAVSMLTWLHPPGICISKTRYPLCHWQLFGPKALSKPMMTLHNPTSSIDICQILYACHAIKGNLSDVCRPASQCSNLPAFKELSASFSPVTDVCSFTELPQTHQRSRVYPEKSLKCASVYLCLHILRDAAWWENFTLSLYERTLLYRHRLLSLSSTTNKKVTWLSSYKALIHFCSVNWINIQLTVSIWRD